MTDQKDHNTECIPRKRKIHNTSCLWYADTVNPSKPSEYRDYGSNCVNPSMYEVLFGHFILPNAKAQRRAIARPLERLVGHLSLLAISFSLHL